jgi:hypothetical protein
VINLKDQELKVFRNLANNTYTSENTYKTGTMTPLAFADIQISVQRLLNP